MEVRILVFSGSPWDDNNSFGNSYSSIFEEISKENLKFANIYVGYGAPNNRLNMRAFQITEKLLLSNLKDSTKATGVRVDIDNSGISERTEHEQNQFNIARKLRWQVMFWARDLIWKVGRWESAELKAFIDEFQPDVIFQPVYYSSYLNDIACFIKQYTNVPMVGYISDDCYTLRQFHVSPLYWIDRLWKRQKVRKTIEQCEILYVISQVQKEEYEKIFTPPCKILTKSADFSKEAPQWPAPEETVRLLYAGNLGAGRWKSLALIAEAVERLNNEGYSVALDTYTATPQTAKMQKALNRPGCRLHGAVSYAQVLELQKTADVLIHAEGLSLKSRLAVHQSFSTKLVDYFAFGKCIFAVGTPDVASIRHLLDNDAAIVASNHKDVYAHLKKILDEPEMIPYYGKQAYACGAKCHNKATMQTMLMEDLRKVVEKNA